MKILLLGELSAFYKNLKYGFEILGVSVTHISTVPSNQIHSIRGADYYLISSLKGVLGKVHTRYLYLKHFRYMKEFDVVLIVNPGLFPQYMGKMMIDYLKKHNKRIYLSACSSDVQYIKYGIDGGFRYWPYSGCEEPDYVNYQKKYEKKLNAYLLDKIDGVIPIMYEYAEPYRKSQYHKLLRSTIPLPINTENITPSYPESKEKIVFFHGLNRECFKGTNYIVEAMERIKAKYPDDVQIVIEGKMSLKKYLGLMKTVDVVIDQCKTYSYGSMNSLYALALGKVLVASLQNECMVEYERYNYDIVNIEPNIDQIEGQLEYIIKNREKLYGWGRKSRKLAEDVHDAKKIARQYVGIFGLEYK